MKYLDKIKKMLGRETLAKKDNVPIVIYENEDIEKECDEWVEYLKIDSFGSVLLDIGFKSSDCVYLYDNGHNDLEFYYSVNSQEVNHDNKLHFSYGAFKDRGAQITIENGNKSISYARKSNNKFEIDLEEIKVSDVIKYTRHYYSSGSIVWFNSKFDDKDYELKLSIFRNFNNDEIFRLDNESELEKYLCSLELPVAILDVFKKICEICKIDLSMYDSFNLELHKKNKRFRNESDVISHIKFMHGEFSSLSYIKDNKKINLKSSGDWSYEMLDDDNLAKLSIDVKNDNITCNIASNNDGEIDDYFKYFALYDINSARSEIENAKKLVKNLFNR